MCGKLPVHGEVQMRRDGWQCVTLVMFSVPRMPHLWDCGEPLPPTSLMQQNDPKDLATELLQDSCMQGEC